MSKVKGLGGMWLLRVMVAVAIAPIAGTLAAQAQPGVSVEVSGKVVDAKGDPLPGVSISVKGSVVGAMTGVDGKFTLRVSGANAELQLKFLGLQTKTVRMSDRPAGEWVITMSADEHAIDEVVVTGFFERDKVSYTGAAVTYSGAELKAISNQNVIQSLKTLDPSFVVIDNLAAGSNPNTMATIELRGQSSSTLNAVKDEFSADPNQPLFVINGVESTLQRVQDLDINRIESITILKDAGSTAIYGSKGSNGVVVIETVKPRAGEFQIYYNGDFQLSAPDLTVFNMMNSAEKLEFERLAGKYTNTRDIGVQKALTDLYNHFAAEIARGVDTYWLSEPVRTGFTNGHSLRVSGGSEALAVDVGVKYKNENGVMKGSGRDTWGGNVDLLYRNNKFQVSNQLNVSGYKGIESPYGSFSTWVNASPYFRKREAGGYVNPYLLTVEGIGIRESFSPISADIPNPLYNAMLGGIDESTQLYVLNNFFLQYMPLDGLRLRAGLDISTTRQTDVKATPPQNTAYDEKDFSQKGERTDRNQTQSYYHAYADGSFGKLFAELHSITLFVRGSIKQTKDEYTSASVEGFPYGAALVPSNAHSYNEDSKAGYSYRLSRQVSLTSAFNYNYDKRYLFDASFSVDGTTTFGSNRLYHPFWSVGVGWNIDREKWMGNIDWLDMLKLRASTGLTGNQNQGRAASQNVYQYFLSSSNDSQQGAYLDQLANPNLPWQVARDYTAGIDFKAKNGRYSLTFDVFQSTTDPNIVFVPQKPSVGIESYPEPLGTLTKRGMEATVMVAPINMLKERIIWTIRVTGAHTRSTYGKLGHALDEFNESQRKSNTMLQYVDGYSPMDIWAVRSYGIDPATGAEVFVTKEGLLTMEYNAKDMVVVGSSRPDVQGTISTSFRYKNWSASINLGYSLGSDIYNTALYNKVENITKSALEQNQDKRALYDRWKNPGDISAFKSIAIVGEPSPKTSRFVQKDNYLRCESINLSYEVGDSQWLRKVGVKLLKVNAYMYDIFRLETSKTERGTDYPFARSVAVGVSLNF